MINAMLLVGGLSIHRLWLVYNGDGDTYKVYFSPYYFINTIGDVQLIALFSCFFPWVSKMVMYDLF